MVLEGSSFYSIGWFLFDFCLSCGRCVRLSWWRLKKVGSLRLSWFLGK